MSFKPLTMQQQELEEELEFQRGLLRAHNEHIEELEESKKNLLSSILRIRRELLYLDKRLRILP